MEGLFRRLGLAMVLASGAACTHKVQIEPSDKPFVVNLNVKVDHEVRHKVESQNEDLLNLEDQVIKKKPGLPGKKSKKG